MPHHEGLPDGVIATWGNVSLEPIDGQGLDLLAHDRNPNVGFFIDFLNDPTLSANKGVPVFRLGGDGAGYVWAATYDHTGKGKLRFLAIDTSALSHPSNIATPGKATSPPNRDAKTDDVPVLGMDQIYGEVGWWTITRNKSDHDSQHHAAILFLELCDPALDKLVRRQQVLGDRLVFWNKGRLRVQYDDPA
jgi:hypothetical protein